MRQMTLSIKKMLTDTRVYIADTWKTRFVGLLNRSGLRENEALLLTPCASIHTIGMRFNIDAVFLGSKGRVLGIKENLKPYRLCFAPKGTEAVLELASGNARKTGISTEQVLRFE